MKKVMFYSLLTLCCAPCGFLQMSIKEQDDSNKHISLTSGEQVAVHIPEIREDLIGVIFVYTGWSEREFAKMLREGVLHELSRRGLNASADSTLNENYLEIYLTSCASLTRGV
jgi:hypothetical protein